MSKLCHQPKHNHGKNDSLGSSQEKYNTFSNQIVKRSNPSTERSLGNVLIQLAGKHHNGLHQASGISQPYDAAEKEADQMADHVMQAPRASCQAPSQAEHNEVQNYSPILGSGGRALDKSTQYWMQQRFAADFSAVRIHTDAQAQQSADALQARAYTLGRHIVFSRGEYQPHTREGRRLLAHELTHSLQQGHSNKVRYKAKRIIQRSMKTYIAAMNEKPESNWALAAEHLNGENIRDIRIVLKRLPELYRAKLHNAARKWPGICSAIGRETEKEYLKLIDPSAKRVEDVCDKPKEEHQLSEASKFPTVADNPKYIENAFKSVGLPIWGGPFYFTSKKTFSSFDKSNIVIPRHDIAFVKDPLKGKSVLLLNDIHASREEALKEERKWASKSGYTPIAYYYGPGGYIFPTIISHKTAPMIAGTAKSAIKLESDDANAASDLSWNLLWWHIGARFPMKANTGTGKPLPPVNISTIKSLKDAMGAKEYATHLSAVKEIIKANPKLAKLSVDELIAIRAYSTEAFVNVIQHALYGAAKATPESQALIVHMMSGLQKLPGYSGTIIRTETKGILALQQYKQGQVFTAQAFFSATKGAGVAQKEGTVFITIHAAGKNGKDIAKISKHAIEKEVLFMPGTRFLVEKAAYLKDALGKETHAVEVILKEL